MFSWSVHACTYRQYMRAARSLNVVRVIKYHQECANHRATAGLVEWDGPVEENYMCCEFVHTHILMNWNLSLFCQHFYMQVC